MTEVLIPGSGVVHANAAKSYGRGKLSTIGQGFALVRFEGEPADRLVRMQDLSPAPALPLATRIPAKPKLRIVYSVQA